MSFPQKFARGVAAVALVAGSSAGVVLISAGSASATAHVHCVLQGGGNYPPSKCYIVFSKGTYHRGDTVHFHGHKVSPGAKVHEHLKCGSLSKSLGTDTANGKGIVKGSFDLPESTPKGHCTLTLTGGGSKIKGGFEAKS